MISRLKKNKKLIIVFSILLFSIGVVFTYLTHVEVNNRDFQSVKSLPYLTYVQDDPSPEKEGVTLFNKEFASPGVNLYVSRHQGSAHIVDMDGDFLHSWFSNDKIGEKWKFAEVDKDGNLIVLVESFGLVKLDWDSNIIWLSNSSENPFNYKCKFQGGEYHHDFQRTENGNIHVLACSVRYIDYLDDVIPIRDDHIVTLNSQGVPLTQLSFFDILGDKIPSSDLAEIEKKTHGIDLKTLLKSFVFKLNSSELENILDIEKGPSINESKLIDVFHVNTIEEIPLDIGVAKKGDILFCARNLNLIGIIDSEQQKVIWSWGSETLQLPHNPTVLKNGNILVFDNGALRNFSRILEINPLTKEVVWKYEANPRDSFFTHNRGSVQRLPNGNTLITESNKGHVFEVTKEGEIVWEFWNPEFNKKGERATIYRMVRLNASEIKQLSDKVN